MGNLEPPFATLVVLGAHVYYGGAATARARSGPALLEATEATPSAIPHSAPSLPPGGSERESLNSTILPAILNRKFCLK